MIPLLTQVIQEHPEWLRCSGVPLSFMKVSTPVSGREVDQGKVLLFVFEVGQATPTLCIKTTRTYAAGDIIRHNYRNLQLLEGGVRGSKFARMFVTPLYLHDDGDLVFSVESACPGVMFSAQTGNIELVVKRYAAWQAHLVPTANIFRTEDLQNLAREAINTLGLTAVSTRVLQHYLEALSLDSNIQLPALVQHGDMTPDNVLVSGNDVCLIDYDYVGLSYLAGFDLFHFLSKLRFRSGSFRSDCQRYFPMYLRSIGARTELSDALLFSYYLQECHRKRHEVKSKDGDEIVADFITIISR